MKLFEIVRFEVDYRLRRRSTLVFFGLFLLLPYLIVSGMLVEEAGRAGDLHANGPAGIAMANILISMIGMVVTAALFSGAALRDLETRMQPLFASSPISRTDYLIGRFAGALIVNVLLVSVVPFALMLFMRPPFVHADLLGPFRAAAYLQPYLFFLLPNLFFTGAVLFAVAVLTRRSLPVFAAALFLFISGLVIEEVVAEQWGRGGLAALIEPFGFTSLSELWELWTPHEKNTRLVDVDGAPLGNRLLWLGAGLLLLAFTRIRFRMELHELRGAARGTTEPEEERPAPFRRSAPTAVSFDLKTRLRQMVAITVQSFRDLAFSRDFALIAIALVALVVVVRGSSADNFGTPFWPLTQFLAPSLGGFFPAMVISLLTAFYAGELIWRERDARLGDIADATPVPNWVMFAGKFGALALLLVAMQAVLMTSAIALQALSGYFRFELGLYLQIVFALQLIDYLLLGALAMLVHVIVDQKYFGHLIVVICHLFTVFARRLGVEQNLLVYGSDSGWVYSDVSGFGPFLRPLLWFKLYWGGWALLFALLATLFWMRGHERGLRRRLRLARLRFDRAAAMTAVAAGLVIVPVGAYLYYNTKVLSGDRGATEAAELRANYERRYGRYERAAQPTVRGTKLHVELYPERRAAHVRGTYALVNATREPIRAIHLSLHRDVQNDAVTFDRQSRMAIDDAAHGHRTYELAKALEPGQSLRMHFEVRFEPRGFPDSGINTSVVGNGTYFDHTGGRNPNHRRWLPLVGYQSSRELSSARTRRELGLPPRPLAQSIDAMSGDGSAGREWIDFEAVIGTAADQTGVAPGTLRRSWSANGRRYFHYVADRPMRNAFAIFSARYAVHEELWKGVKIELFHHPTHTFNVPRFVRSVRASLDYYREHFGPYPHRQIRIVEFPRYASLAYAYPGTISYAEAFGWVTKVDEEQHVDLPSAVVAHEVAHQWWGHQVAPAPVEGAAMLTEVLAQYSALMVTEKIHGPEMVRRFLSTTRIEYLNRRGRAEHGEVPLLLVADHANLVYRKGPLVMYALRQYIGEGPLNAALRRFAAKHRSGQPPYPTSRDLYRELQAATPPAYHYLLEDLLETITLWRLRTTRATAEPAGEGQWRVTLEVDAQKLRAAANGKESEVPMNDFVEIGVFGAGKEGELGPALYLAKHRIRSGAQRITVVVRGRPERAGIDPHLHLIDRTWSDNSRGVSGVGR